MEEILASIKRVIAEDSRARPPRPRRVRARADRAAPEPAPEEDVLELDDPVSEASGLLSDDAAAASRQRLASLSALRQRSEAPADSGALEAVVREMLRPMLKDWLDQHLPEIVEDLVTREIARITGRATLVVSTSGDGRGGARPPPHEQAHAREPCRCSLSPRRRPPSPARSPPPISPPCGGSAARASRRTAIGRSTSSARPISPPIAAAPTSSCSICARPARQPVADRLGARS